jgi:hypothetical protein
VAPWSVVAGLVAASRARAAPDVGRSLRRVADCASSRLRSNERPSWPPRPWSRRTDAPVGSGGDVRETTVEAGVVMVPAIIAFLLT